MIDILASGLIVGAAYAALGIGLTLVAKMSGVVSFAQSAVALLGCFTGLVVANSGLRGSQLEKTIEAALAKLKG